MIDQDDVVMHYGVKGMKWGVRKDAETGKTTTAKKANGPAPFSVAAEAGMNAAKPFMGFMVPRLSARGLVMQAGFAALKGVEMSQAFNPVSIGVGAAVSVADSGAYRVPGVVIKNSLKGGWNRDESLADPKMSLANIEKKVVAGVNPKYPGVGTTNNCLRASYTYEMRRRGFDVTATKTVFGTGQTANTQKFVSGFKEANQKIKNERNQSNKLVKAFKGEQPLAKDVFKAMANEPDRSRGEFQVQWKGMRGGHSIAYEIINNKPVFIDSQSGKIMATAAQLDKMMIHTSKANYTRLDNRDLNSLAMAAWVKDAG